MDMGDVLSLGEVLGSRAYGTAASSCGANDSDGGTGAWCWYGGTRGDCCTDCAEGGGRLSGTAATMGAWEVPVNCPPVKRRRLWFSSKLEIAADAPAGSS